MAQCYGVRPSEFVAITDSLIAYQFDEAIWARGREHESEQAAQAGGNPPLRPSRSARGRPFDVARGRLTLRELRRALLPGGRGLTFSINKEGQ